MSIILDINNQKVHMEGCKLLKEKMDSKNLKKIDNQKEIPENYTHCEVCSQKKKYNETKWGSLV